MSVLDLLYNIGIDLAIAIAVIISVLSVYRGPRSLTHWVMAVLQLGDGS